MLSAQKRRLDRRTPKWLKFVRYDLLGSGIAVGVGLLPGPGRGDDCVEGGVRGLPGQVAAHFIGGGDQDGGIAGTAGEEFFGDVAAGEAAGGGEDFADGVAGAGADVEGGAGDAAEFLEGAEMGLRDVEDVDVIADAGAVGSGIVAAKNGDVGGAGLDSLQDEGNEVRFVAAGFAAIAGGAGYVEIAEGDVI